MEKSDPQLANSTDLRESSQDQQSLQTDLQLTPDLLVSTVRIRGATQPIHSTVSKNKHLWF